MDARAKVLRAHQADGLASAASVDVHPSSDDGGGALGRGRAHAERVLEQVVRVARRA